MLAELRNIGGNMIGCVKKEKKEGVNVDKLKLRFLIRVCCAVKFFCFIPFS